MIDERLIMLLYGLAAAFFLLFIIGLLRNLGMRSREKHSIKDSDAIKSSINKFIGGTEKEYRTGLLVFIRETLDNNHIYRSMVDKFLLETLENPDLDNRQRFIAVAIHLGFPAECLAQVKSWNPGITALGSRRAGLYNIKEAVKDMESALDSFSSENQFEILMALARMGGAETLQRAFEKISNRVLVNERGIIQILSVFPDGEEKQTLFKRMIHGNTEYLAALFLKAVTADIAGALAADIEMVFGQGGKEVRASAVRAIASLGNEAPAQMLVEAMEDKDWEVRALAAKALGPVSEDKTSMALYLALYDLQWWVRQNAANALAKHHGYETLFILAAESGDKYARDSVIAALGNGANPALLESLKMMAA